MDNRWILLKNFGNNMSVVIKDFYGEGCGPCRLTGQNLERVLNTHPELVVEKIDAEDEDDLVEEFGIRSIPTLVYLKDGVEVKRTTGLQSAQQIEDVLKSIEGC